MTIEKRIHQHATKIELRKDGDGKDSRTITGYAAVFYDGKEETQFRWCSDYVERVAKGAFERAIKEDDVRALFNHDDNIVLGRNRADTLRIEEDERGLRFECDVPETVMGDSVLESVKRGDVTGCSFSFNATATAFTTEGEGAEEITVRTINEVKLYDVGPVTFPAYEGTDVQARSCKEATEAREAYQEEQGAEERQAEAKRDRDIATAQARVLEIEG